MTAIRVDRLRCDGDRNLEGKLLEEPIVERAVEQAEQEGSHGARQKLLARAVRVTPAMSPTLESVATRCRERLGLDDPLEMYVYPDSMFNAACLRSDGERVLVLLSSQLLEHFDEPELTFAVGHELGHHLFGHHRIPIGELLSGQLDEVQGPLTLQLFAWSRYAEISADRAGMVCAGELDCVARALFKLASGLTSSVVKITAEALLSQVGDMQQELAGLNKEQSAHRTDWFATHPFSPIRLKAAVIFSESELFLPKGTPKAKSRDQLEAEVLETMTLMEPGYLIEKTDQAEALRRLLFAGGVLVADATDGISPEELNALERFFGDGAVSERLSVDAVRDDLDRRVRFVREVVPPARRAQVIRDLCLVALADGHADEAERKVIEGIARDIDVDTAIIDQTLALNLD
ncbi:MAG: M48 family metalloprotease [Deltaproteobacteria bacterium]|jgi:tellurite resistance protein|nr:M48 family metalloprotease [Deltaproteobacteria bacterium]MBW2536034.1 M48 family metalloprotease [Deltaproteobacteria bacterium]